ncbi:MAG: hypothetical protein KF784_09885 [Fimbriimonadaceae bacterium]|nr:hypothetical protein [Fimbriimonadaceae bacterium]
MLTAIVVLILGQTKPADYFSKCLKAHTALKAADVTIRSNTAVGDPSKPGTFRLVFVKPSQVRLQIINPAVNEQAASNRTFAIVGNRVTAYDATVDEKLSLTLEGSGDIAEKLSAVIPSVNDSVMAVLDPKRLTEIMKPFRDLKDWTVSKEGADVVLVRRTGSQSSARWQIDGKTFLLKKLTLVAGSTMDWSYSYGPTPKSAAYTPPPSAVAVSEFKERIMPPKYKDATAKRVGTAAIVALDRLKNAHFTLTTEDGTSKVWLSAGMIREELKGRSWAYDGATLTALVDTAKRHYASRKGRSSAVDSLADVKMEATPFVRTLLMRRNPLNSLLREGLTVEHNGTIVLAGVKCDLLESNGMGLRHLLTLRADNHLPIEIRTENRFPGTDEVIVSELKFKYIGLGQPIPSSVFKLSTKKGYMSGAFPKPKV